MVSYGKDQRIWTQSAFEKPNIKNHHKFDDNGVRQDDMLQALDKKIPNDFLLIALIQQLCSVYFENADKAKETFNKLCRQLVGMKILPPLAIHEDFKAVREKYVSTFHDVLQAAAGSDENTTGLRPLPSSRILGRTSRSPSLPRQLVQAKHLLEYNTARYKEEFHEIERLGKGGFGSVYQVKNKLDGRQYAVKKIYLNEKDISNCLKVLREVKILAKLRHPNVVGYQSAWLEFVSPDDTMAKAEIPRISTHPGRLVDLDDESPLPPLFGEESVGSDGIVFEHSTGNSENDFNVEEKSSNPLPERSLRSPRRRLLPAATMTANSVGFHKSASDASLSRFMDAKSYKNSHLHNFFDDNSRASHIADDSSKSNDSINDKRFGIVLFIQMELCEITLQQWLQQRNSDICSNGAKIKEDDNIAIFKQIIDGMADIHSHKLIHRDIKPNNIFLKKKKCFDDGYDYQVKIGDFGLARTGPTFDHSDPDELTSMIEPIFPCESSKRQTLGVGTCTYASPEQLHNENYSSKVDVYSLGIVLFELYQPFSTEMEKYKQINEIRRGESSKDFKERWPKQNELILHMMSPDPEKRPATEEIAKTPFLNKKNQSNTELLEQLKTERLENEQLRKRISELEEELRSKTEQISTLQNDNVEKRCRRTTF